MAPTATSWLWLALAALLLAQAACQGSPSPSPAVTFAPTVSLSSIALLYDKRISDTRLLGEATRVNSLLSDLPQRDLQRIPRLETGGLRQALQGRNVFVVPEMENSGVADVLDDNDVTAFLDFVQGGGVLVLMQTGGLGQSSRDVQLLDRVFGFQVETRDSGVTLSDAVATRVQPLETPPFESIAAAELPAFDGTYPLKLESLPSDSTVFWATDEYAFVWESFVGDGVVRVLAHDYFVSGGSQGSVWDDILVAASSGFNTMVSPTPAPTPAVQETDPSGLNVRLVSTGDPKSGRIEVLHDGRWGTVCRDGWSGTDAEVVCSMLGYSSAAVSFFADPAADDVPIWLSNVGCTGQESSLFDCPSPGFGVHSCDHSEDVGVACITTSSNDDDDRIGQSSQTFSAAVFTIVVFIFAISCGAFVVSMSHSRSRRRQELMSMTSRIRISNLHGTVATQVSGEVEALAVSGPNGDSGAQLIARHVQILSSDDSLGPLSGENKYDEEDPIKAVAIERYSDSIEIIDDASPVNLANPHPVEAMLMFSESDEAVEDIIAEDALVAEFAMEIEQSQAEGQRAARREGRRLSWRRPLLRPIAPAPPSSSPPDVERGVGLQSEVSSTPSVNGTLGTDTLGTETLGTDTVATDPDIGRLDGPEDH